MAMPNMYDNKGFGTPNAINSMAENPTAKKAQDKGSSIPTENIAGLHAKLQRTPDAILARMIGSGQPQGLEAMLAMLVAGDRANMRQNSVQAPPPGEKTMAEQAIASLGGGAPQIPGGGITGSLQAPAQAPAQAQAAPIMAAQGGLIRLQGGGPVFGSGTTREDKLSEAEKELARRIASNSMTEKDSNDLNYLNQHAKHKSDWIYNKAQDIVRETPPSMMDRAGAAVKDTGKEIGEGIMKLWDSPTTDKDDTPVPIPSDTTSDTTSDSKDTPNPLLDNLKNKIAQKEPEKSFWEKVLGPDYRQKLDAAAALSKHTEGYSDARLAQAESQRKLQGTQATARAAGRATQWDKAMTAQTQTENALLKVEQDLANIKTTGSQVAKDALYTRMKQLEEKLRWLRKLTGSPSGVSNLTEIV